MKKLLTLYGFVFVFIICMTSTIQMELTTVFDLDTYNNTCTETDDNTTSIHVPNCVPCDEFIYVVKCVMSFTCTGDFGIASKAFKLATSYMLKWNRAFNLHVRSSVNKIDELRQFTALYNNITNYRILVEELTNDTRDTNIEFGDIGSTYAQFKKKHDILIHEFTAYAKCAWALKNVTLTRNLGNIFLTELYKIDILNDTRFLENRDLALLAIPNQSFIDALQLALYKVWPAIMGVIFVVGIAGNGLLLLIFLRHPEMRTIHNVMLMNLVLMDLISLTFNLPIVYVMYSRKWQYDVLVCQCSLFLRTLTLSVSTYSVVIISYQRLCAVSTLKATRASRLSNTLLALGLWLIAILYSIPAFIFGTIIEKDDFCKFYNSFDGIKAATDFTVICVIPVFLVSVFSTLASFRLRKSATNIPGERMGQEKRIRDRIVTSRVLIGLVLVFFFSYVPFSVYNFLIMYSKHFKELFSNINASYWGSYFLIAIFLENMLFLNAMLNPAVLYFLSNKFKKYFNNYLFCKCNSTV